MQVMVSTLEDAAYWSWGCGGHKLKSDECGDYPVHVAPNLNYHANAWIPHFVTTKNASLKYHPGPYVGWKQMYLGHHSRIAVFLREFKDNQILITTEEQQRMRDAAIHMGYNWGTLAMSEIVLHDKDMNPIRHITNVFQPLWRCEPITLFFEEDSQRPLF